MQNLSINTAWNETAAFVKREAGLLFPIAFALIALPAAFFQAMAPRTVPGTTPEPGSWMLLFIPVIVLSMIGTLTLTVLALRPGTVVADALKTAARRFLPVLGAILLLVAAAALASVPLAILLVMFVSQAVLTALMALVFLGAFIFLWVRLMLMNPVGAVEPLGPIAIIRRSWALTAGHFWRLFGFVLLMVDLFLVLSFAVSAVGGILIVLVAGAPEPGSLGAVLILLLAALLNTILSVYFTTIIARIYAQLSGFSTNGI